MRSIFSDVIERSPSFTPEQKIAIAVYKATLDAILEEEAKIERYAQTLRDAADTEGLPGNNSE